METVKIRFDAQKWEEIRNNLELCQDTDYTIEEVFVKDELFKDDEKHRALVKQLVKAKEQLKEYEFKKRHNIK